MLIYIQFVLEYKNDYTEQSFEDQGWANTKTNIKHSIKPDKKIHAKQKGKETLPWIRGQKKNPAASCAEKKKSKGPSLT